MKFLIYLLIVIIGIVVINWLNKKTFQWETIIKYLWKQIFHLAWLMGEVIQHGNESLYIDNYKKKIDLRGNIINAIIDYINSDKKEESEEFEESDEETFGYGRYYFKDILNRAKNNHNSFKNLK